MFATVGQRAPQQAVRFRPGEPNGKIAMKLDEEAMASSASPPAPKQQ
jgi:hypothetical protein